MYEVKLYRSKWKAIKLILLSLPFLLFGLWDLNKEYTTTPAWMDWVAICFLGLGLPLGIFYLVDNRPQIIFNENGILNKMHNSVFIAWDTITDIHLYVMNNRYKGLPLSKHKFICLKLDNSVLKTKKKETKSWSNFGLGDYSIPLMTLKSIDEQKLIDFIKSMSKANSEAKRTLLVNFPETL